ncbi:MAG: DUF362 domain-containing protein [Bacillota bacterium]|nr:DUF362 domain-containing protein [Bacillota bacterium]MDI7249072.1 DUF362 domain-containing protein [Bacillota bacterium]
MAGPVVSVVKFEEPYRSLQETLDLCDGFRGLDPSDRILIKPNLVIWDFDLPFPPFGVVTTSAVVFALVQILAEKGLRRITIGEAGSPAAKTQGRAIYKVLGYEKLRDTYGVELVDFNEERFEPVDFGGFTLSVARRALEADKIINVPVLKTHNQCKVSLGIKNLKGVLDRKSKMFCHHPERDLNHVFPRIAGKLPVALTVIDGIFTLEKGPGPTGRAHRKDLLIASRDVLACDIVGAEIMGYRAEDVPSLKYYAECHGRSLDLADIQVRGEEIEKHRSRVEYDWEWTSDNTGPIGFEKRGIKGIAVRKYDDSLCTGCSVLYNPMLIMLMSSFKGEPFPGIEVVSGKRQLASKGFTKTVLFGKCACELNKNNENIVEAIPIRGCPPDLKRFEKAMCEAGIDCSYADYVKYRHYLFNRYKDRKEFDMGLYLY